jgi:hypothetical protein
MGVLLLQAKNGDKTVLEIEKFIQAMGKAQYALKEPCLRYLESIQWIFSCTSTLLRVCKVAGILAECSARGRQADQNQHGRPTLYHTKKYSPEFEDTPLPQISGALSSRALYISIYTILVLDFVLLASALLIFNCPTKVASLSLSLSLS